MFERDIPYQIMSLTCTFTISECRLMLTGDDRYQACRSHMDHAQTTRFVAGRRRGNEQRARWLSDGPRVRAYEELADLLHDEDARGSQPSTFFCAIQLRGQPINKGRNGINPAPKFPCRGHQFIRMRMGCV